MLPLPDANQARVFGVVAAAFNLHREPQHLQKQHSYKYHQVAVAAKHGFHGEL
jgi:hypothetical protein